jgi:hypothetical protein
MASDRGFVRRRFLLVRNGPPQPIDWGQFSASPPYQVVMQESTTHTRSHGEPSAVALGSRGTVLVLYGGT